MSKARLSRLLTRALVGTEKLAPELEKATRKFVSHSGYMNEKALGSRRLLGDILIGKKGAGNVIKARYAQGGMLGPGGLVMGELAVDPRYKELLKRVKSSSKGKMILDPYSGKKITRGAAAKRLVGSGIMEGINPLFADGFPLLDVYGASKKDDTDPDGGMTGILGSLGSGLGFAAAGPLGLVGGMAVGSVGENVGRSIGRLFDPEKKRPNDIILDAAVPR